MYFCSQTLNNIIDRAFPKQILKFQNAVKSQVTVFLLKYLLTKIYFFYYGGIEGLFPSCDLFLPYWGELYQLDES